jgi:choline dehydrogenase-like flavoprotein
MRCVVRNISRLPDLFQGAVSLLLVACVVLMAVFTTVTRRSGARGCGSVPSLSARGEETRMALYDVVIAGGGAAGLSAALVLGRCRRSVLVCDDGHPRNEASHAVHCLLGNEGIPPVNSSRKDARSCAPTATSPCMTTSWFRSSVGKQNSRLPAPADSESPRARCC